MKILLSIKPEFAELIFDGIKKYEFRKAIPKTTQLNSIIVYATRPVAMIVGEFSVRGVICGSPDAVWKKTKHAAGISREFFESYYEGRRSAYAFEVDEVVRYADPLEPESVFEGFTAPQSFKYVRSNEAQQLHLI